MSVITSSMHFNHPPFVYHNGMWAERSSRADCSKERVIKLLAARRFKRIDRVILHALGQYGYLNAYLLRRYALMKGFRNADQVLVKERLSFLLKNGLIFRYEFFHADPLTGAVNGSPFIYGLSGGGWMFLKMSYRMHLASGGIRSFYEFPDMKDGGRIAQILSLLAENQFAVLFEAQYAERIQMRTDINGKCFAGCGQRMEYHISLPDGRKMCLYPVAVRQYPGWEDFLLGRLRAIRDYYRDYYRACGEKSCAVLVLCESSEHALACENTKQSAELSDMDVFYGLDHTIAGSPDVFGRMLEVRREGEHLTRSYFRLDLCGASSLDCTKEESEQRQGDA